MADIHFAISQGLYANQADQIAREAEIQVYVVAIPDQIYARAVPVTAEHSQEQPTSLWGRISGLGSSMIENVGRWFAFRIFGPSAVLA